jgi:hypothetical protein
MTPNQYVLSVVSKYSAQAGANSRAVQAAAAVSPILRAWASQYFNDIQLSGSYAKNTAISGGADVDLFISLRSNAPGTLKEFYFSLRDSISEYRYTPALRNVSMRINHDGVAIDLVPGKMQSPYTTDHSLYKRKADTVISTNINTHIKMMLKSGMKTEIKAIKIWKLLHELEFPSFYLEMAVLEALKDHTIGNYSDNVIAVMKWLRDYLETATLYDPSNTNNELSDDLTRKEKLTIAAQASKAIQAQSWADIIW